MEALTGMSKCAGLLVDRCSAPTCWTASDELFTLSGGGDTESIQLNTWGYLGESMYVSTSKHTVH